MSKAHWISQAIRHKGSLTRQAKKEGDTPMEFAREHKNSPGKTGARSRLALTLATMRKKK